MQILPINDRVNLKKTQEPNFCGITKRLSHHMFIDGKKDIVELLNRTKPKNTNVGTLPPVIFYAISKEGRGDKIRKIIKTFGEVAEEIRGFRPTSDKTSQERSNRRPQSVVDKLKATFIDLGLLNEKDTFDLVFLGEGNYKKAYKLEGIKDPKTNEELCLKVFHLVDKTPEWHKYKTHGNYAELNTSAYWKKTQGMYTQRGKFYFGDIDTGFFVDKFIDKNVSSPQKNVDEFTLGIKLTDEVKADSGHNKLYGYSIDPGGPRVVNRVKNMSRIAQKVFEHIKKTPSMYREQEWFRLFYTKNKFNKEQNEAGLAISIKHLKRRSEVFNLCLQLNKPFVDMGLAYVLKYLKDANAKKYFEILMKRNDPITQTVLLNEIPLLARAKVKVDDLDVPKGEINSKKLAHYYSLAREFVLPEVEQHLASFLHLLPDEQIMPEAKRLLSKNNYEINDRLLHKIKFVKDEEFPFSTKMEILNLLAKTEQADYLKQKTNDVKIHVIRNQLED